MFDTAAWECAEKILCIRLDALGELVMTTPALRALKESHPGRRVTLLTSPAGAAVAPLLSGVDQVIVYEAPWKKQTPPKIDSRFEFDLIDRLRFESFDGAVIFTVCGENPLPAALLGYLADIPLRLAHCRDDPCQLLTHWVPDAEPHEELRHEVRRQLDLVASIGGKTKDERLTIRVPEAARKHVRRALEALGLDTGRPWVAMHPGGLRAPTQPGSPQRNPPEGFARAARRLILDGGFQVLFAGAAQERELVERIRAALALPSYSLVGALNLSELAALLAEAPVLMSNNTGPVQLAAAVGTPVIELFARPDPQHTPWGVPHRVLITPGAIVQSTYELLNETQRVFGRSTGVPVNGHAELTPAAGS